MDENARYARLGLFVLVAAGLLLAGIVILGSGTLFSDELIAETYLDESVQGLAEGSPVKARGITVGRVERITFAFSEYEEGATKATATDDLVVVVLRLDNNHLKMLPERFDRFIEEGLRIRLAMAGITGGSYLEMEIVDPTQYPQRKVPWTPRRPVIPSMPSKGTQFLASVDKILGQLASANLDAVAGDLRTAAATITRAVDQDLVPVLREVKTAAGSVPPVADRLTRALATIETLAGQLSKAVDQELRPAAGSLAEAAKEVPPAVREAGRAVRRAGDLIAGQRETIGDILENLRAATDELRLLAGQLRRNPAGALFADPPPRTETPRKEPK